MVDFSDLIPDKNQKPSSGRLNFDDLIPKKPVVASAAHPSAPPTASPSEARQSHWYDNVLGPAESLGTGLAVSLPGLPGNIIQMGEAAHKYVGDLGRKWGVNTSPPSAPETNPLLTSDELIKKGAASSITCKGGPRIVRLVHPYTQAVGSHFPHLIRNLRIMERC